MFTLQEDVAQISYVTQLYVTHFYFMTVLRTQTTWNLMFSVLSWPTFICGPKFNLGQMFCKSEQSKLNSHDFCVTLDRHSSLFRSDRIFYILVVL